VSFARNLLRSNVHGCTFERTEQGGFGLQLRTSCASLSARPQCLSSIFHFFSCIYNRLSIIAMDGARTAL